MRSTFTMQPGTCAASQSAVGGGNQHVRGAVADQDGDADLAMSNPHGRMTPRSSSAQPPTPTDARPRLAHHLDPLLRRQLLAVPPSLSSKPPSTLVGSSATRAATSRAAVELAWAGTSSPARRPAELLDVLRVHALQAVLLREPGARTAPRRRRSGGRPRSGRRAATARACGPPPEPPVTASRSRPRGSASAATSTPASTMRPRGRRVDGP